MQSDQRCCTTVRPTALETARSFLPIPSQLKTAATLFKMCGDPTRMRILASLLAGELCVCELSALCGMSSSAVSHQLALLRQVRLVESRREGKSIFYRLDDDHVRDLLALGIRHAAEEEEKRS